MAELWKGFRHDSGNPFEFGEKVVAFYQSLGINPRKKLIVFSDGLDIEVILAIHKRFKGRINITFGWGTNLTNDLGFLTLSLVNKVLFACGRPTIKLSDDLGKSTGEDATEKERYVRVFDYHNTFLSKQVY
jgi:nicotinate phosphoribosyltransferase